MMSLEDLVTFEHYFLHWQGEVKVTPDMFEQLILEIRFLKSSSNSGTEEDIDFNAEMKNVQVNIVPFVQIFLEIVTGLWEEARHTLNTIEEILANLNKNEFTEGFEFMHCLVVLHFKMAAPKNDENLSPGDIDREPTLAELKDKYNQLEPKSKCVVALSHWLLNLSSRNCRPEGVQILKNIIELDSTNWYWYHLMYSRQRFLRRSYGDTAAPTSKPSEEEMKSVTTALEYVDEHPKCRLRCTANLCQCLAEIVAYQNRTNTVEPVTLDMTYENGSEMVARIKAAAWEAMLSPSCGFGEYIRYGDIFGVILPVNHRDYMLAMELMKIACTKYPDNSKVNHKMGAICINAKKGIEIAIPHFEAAVRLDPRNFAAWMELLPALLLDYKENEVKFKTHVENVLKLEQNWTKLQLGAFYFFEGSMTFLIGSKDPAVELWRKSLQHGYHGFKELGRIRGRFNWPREHPLTFEAVRRTLDQAKRRELDLVTIEEIDQLQEMVIEGERKLAQFFKNKKN